MILGNLKIEREPLMYGLAEVLSDKTGRNLVCHKTMDREMFLYDEDHPYGYEINSIYHFVEDEKEVFNVTSVNSFVKINEDFIEISGENLDKFIILSAAANLFADMSLRYHKNLMPLLDELIKSRNFFNKVNENKVNEVIQKHIGNKVYSK